MSIESLAHSDKYSVLIEHPESIADYEAIKVRDDIRVLFEDISNSTDIPGFVAFVPVGSSVAKWALRRACGIKSEIKDVDGGAIIDSSQIRGSVRTLTTKLNGELGHGIHRRGYTPDYEGHVEYIFFDLNPNGDLLERSIEGLNSDPDSMDYPLYTELLSLALPFLIEDQEIQRRAYQIIKNIVDRHRQQNQDSTLTVEFVLTKAFETVLSLESEKQKARFISNDYENFINDSISSVGELAAEHARNIVTNFDSN